MIWFNKNITLNDFAYWNKNTLAEHLDIHITEIGEDFLKATMPVDKRTHQPYGLLHGGASVALAETVGSVASALVIDKETQMCVGLDINANHIRGVKSGLVTAVAKPLHIGSTTHVWEIKIYDEKEKLVCISRLTVAILKQKPLYPKL
ncbi:MAG: hotdog fold thioesterase [Chitinophagaceae bacterium]|nr:hotdog fold thioesterase [Chitinophagaceae bacterium]MCW5904949.1 hotdog fold thioesterase [Chitinophagaceae bacterium]